MNLSEAMRRRARNRAAASSAGRRLRDDRRATAQMMAATSAASEERMIDTSFWEEYQDGTGLAIAAEVHRIAVLYTKLTERRAVDKTVRQWAAAKKYGIRIGGYHFWRPGDGELEAQIFLATRSALEYTDLPPILDFEQQANPPAAICADFWNFAERVEQRSGGMAWIYTGANYLPASESLRARFYAHEVIIAAYPTPRVTLTEANQWDKQTYSYQEPDLLGWPAGRVVGWQFNPKGRITGCTAGGTDLNWHYPTGIPSSPPANPDPPATGLLAVTTAPLNVRAGPGVTYAIVGGLANGTKVTVDRRQTGWAHITNPDTGWVSEAYLRYL